MSRYQQKTAGGEWEEIIDDINDCCYLVDEVCCNHESNRCPDFPDADVYCKKACPNFTPEVKE